MSNPTQPPVHGPTSPDTDTVIDTPTTPPPVLGEQPSAGEAPLRREAVVLVHDRGRFAVLVALCTLAGVAVGFVLGTFAGGGDDPPPVAMAAPQAPIAIAPDAPCSPPPHSHKHSYGRDFLQMIPDVDIFQSDPHAWLGVQLEDANNGARVTKVMPGSPAAAAGLENGDVIQQVDGEGVATASQLSRLVRDHDPGDEVTIVLERGGNEITLKATLGKMGGRNQIRVR